MAQQQHLAKLLADQNIRIDACKKEYADATTAFFESSQDDRKEAMLRMYIKQKAYFACIESCISEGSVAGAFEHEDWIRDRCGSADAILTKLPRLQEHLRKKGQKLGISEGAFEPSPTSLQMMQGLLATFHRERAKELKAVFSAANLPILGFDKPLSPKRILPEHQGNTVHFHAPVTNPKIDMKTNNISTSGTGNIINVADYIVDVTNTVTTNITESGASDEVKNLIQELSAQVKDIAESINQTQLHKMGKNLKKLSEEVASATPDRDWYEVSLKGLSDAAKAVGDLGVPIIKTLAKLSPLLLA